MKNFIKVKQDFGCGNCGNKVIGNGYTDHCPKCLWGKHVDEEIPGDRASTCRGLMEPTSAEFSISNLQFTIKYKCTKCRHEFWVKAASAKSFGEPKDDDRELLMSLLN